MFVPLRSAELTVWQLQTGDFAKLSVWHSGQCLLLQGKNEHNIRITRQIKVRLIQHMKILQLNLLAFGPFTDMRLDFSDTEGLHIIYGPNEAGKSSALRGLRQMLYGIPHITSDNFIHPNQKLRIGAVLCRRDGSRLEIVRRKGRVNTLRTAGDTDLIDEAHLKSFLGSVDESLFATMFGIDHAGLVQGGKEIIQGGGDIGQILFAAGSGIADFRKIQSNLQSQASGLFAPRAQNPAINRGIRSFADNRRALRDAQLSAPEWEQHEDALDRALNEKQSLEKDREEKFRALARFERIRDGLPLMARRKELLDQFAADADAVLLPQDFGERRRDAMTKFRIAENEAGHASKSLEAVQQSLNAMNIPESLIEHAERIEYLSQELGSHRKAMKDRLRLEGLRSSAQAEAREIIRGLPESLREADPMEASPFLNMEKAEMIRIQELGESYGKLITRLESAQADIDRLSLRVQLLKKQLAETEIPRDVEPLREAVEIARQQGDLDVRYQAACADIRKLREKTEIELKKLRLWSGTLEALETLPVPPLETIGTFEDRLRDAENLLGKQRTEIAETARVLVEIRGRIEALRLEQEVPTEDDLMAARQEREQNWQQIKDTLFLENEIYSVEGFPERARIYETSVRRADVISDRLRREADRVAKKAALLAERETRQHHHERLNKQLEKDEAAYHRLKAEWTELWEGTGISPKSPREMRAWVQKQHAIAGQVSGIRERKAKADDLRSEIERCRNGLLRCLNEFAGFQSPAEDESLRPLVEKGMRVIDHTDQLRAKQERIASDLDQRETELREAQNRAERTRQELSEWQSGWMKAVSVIGLAGDAAPSQANAVIADIKALSVKLREAEILRKRIKGIDRDAAEFEQKVRELAAQEAPDLDSRPAEQVISELNARLIRARTAKAQEQGLKKQAAQEEARLRNAERGIAEIRAHLTAMCEEAGCANYEDLPRAEERSARRQQTGEQLKQIEAQLRKLSAGAPLEEFIRDAHTVDPDTIGAWVSSLTQAVEQLNQKKSELDQTIGSERAELRKMDGNAKAAELAEEAQGILARMETDVEQYVRLRLAAAVLSQAIERYREKNQGPVLTRSNALFSHMTLVSYQGIRLEFNEKGESVLVGVRPGGEIVPVEGMSDGTADQLYLAIRLASLEAYLEKNEPLPFIVDDILIQFDDNRAVAALQLLAQLSERTQVIFFTHHRHLVELAEKYLNGKVLELN
jgi:uncharacterized protein YhaN